MSEKVISVLEFKNWLEGVLDFQDENWTPNLDQWQKILQKINSLDVSTSSPLDNTTKSSIPQTPKPILDVGNTPVFVPQVAVPQATVNLDQKVQLPKAEPLKPPAIKVSKSAPRIIEGENGERVIDTGDVHVMPNDNSGRPYKSTFV